CFTLPRSYWTLALSERNSAACSDFQCAPSRAAVPSVMQLAQRTCLLWLGATPLNRLVEPPRPADPVSLQPKRIETSSSAAMSTRLSETPRVSRPTRGSVASRRLEHSALQSGTRGRRGPGPEA